MPPPNNQPSHLQITNHPTPTKQLELREAYYNTATLPLKEYLAQHNLTPAQVPGCLKWNKPTELIIAPTISTSIDSQDYVGNLSEAKELILAKALSLLQPDAKGKDGIDSVKEFKDVVSIIDTLDRQEKGTPTDEGSINIYIQQIMNNFKDDC